MRMAAERSLPRAAPHTRGAAARTQIFLKRTFFFPYFQAVRRLQLLFV